MQIFLTVIAATLIAAGGAFASDFTERVAALQFAMQDHIENEKIDGAILSVNFNTGEVEKLYPVEAHPMVIELTNGYALCSDLARADGSTVPLDVYMIEDKGEIVIFETVIANRGPLAKLIKTGKATRIR